MSKVIKIRPVGTSYMRTDIQTEMTKLISRFSQFCEKALIITEY